MKRRQSVAHWEPMAVLYAVPEMIAILREMSFTKCGKRLGGDPIDKRCPPGRRQPCLSCRIHRVLDAINGEA